MIKPRRFPSRHAKELNSLATSLGHVLVRRDGNHWVYNPPFTHSATPSDYRATVQAVSDLKRLHPDTPTQPTKRRRKLAAQPTLPSEALAVLRDKNEQKRVARDARRQQAALRALQDRDCDCGRIWISDLSPVGRRCPSCDGWVVRPDAEEAA